MRFMEVVVEWEAVSTEKVYSISYSLRRIGRHYQAGAISRELLW